MLLQHTRTFLVLTALFAVLGLTPLSAQTTEINSAFSSSIAAISAQQFEQRHHSNAQAIHQHKQLFESHHFQTAEDQNQVIDQKSKQDKVLVTEATFPNGDVLSVEALGNQFTFVFYSHETDTVCTKTILLNLETKIVALNALSYDRKKQSMVLCYSCKQLLNPDLQDYQMVVEQSWFEQQD